MTLIIFTLIIWSITTYTSFRKIWRNMHDNIARFSRLRSKNARSKNARSKIIFSSFFYLSPVKTLASSRLTSFSAKYYRVGFRWNEGCCIEHVRGQKTTPTESNAYALQWELAPRIVPSAYLFLHLNFIILSRRYGAWSASLWYRTKIKLPFAKCSLLEDRIGVLAADQFFYAFHVSLLYRERRKKNELPWE